MVLKKLNNTFKVSLSDHLDKILSIGDRAPYHKTDPGSSCSPPQGSPLVEESQSFGRLRHGVDVVRAKVLDVVDEASFAGRLGQQDLDAGHLRVPVQVVFDIGKPTRRVDLLGEVQIVVVICGLVKPHGCPSELVHEAIERAENN